MSIDRKSRPKRQDTLSKPIRVRSALLREFWNLWEANGCYGATCYFTQTQKVVELFYWTALALLPTYICLTLALTTLMFTKKRPVSHFLVATLPERQVPLYNESTPQMS